jgi:HK97 family phage major capsid protein
MPFPKIHRLQAEKIETRVMPVVPSSYDEKTHSFECVAATENVVRVLDYDRWEIVNEILLMSGYRAPASSPDKSPLLDTHMRYTTENVLGSGRDWRIEADKLICRGYISSVETDVETKIREGHIDSVSLGYSVDQSVWVEDGTTAMVNGRQFTGPVKVATQWTRREISLVPIGADDFGKIRSMRAAQLGLPETAMDEEIRSMIQKLNNPQSRKESSMTLEELQAKIKEMEGRVAALTTDAEKHRTEATTAKTDLEKANLEATNVREIVATVALYPNRADIVKAGEKAIAEKRSALEFQRDVMKLIGTNPTPAPNGDEARTNIIVLGDAKKPWEVRTAMYLKSLVLEARGNTEEARTIRTELQKMYKELPEQAKNDELREAVDLISHAPITPKQQKRVMSSLNGGAGGFAVNPAPLFAEIFVLVEQYGAARRYFRQVSMLTDSIKLSSVATKVVAYWTLQNGRIKASDLGLSQDTLTVAKLAGITVWTSELDEDQAISLLPIIIDAFAESIAHEEDKAAFFGDGTATYGSQTGWLNDVGTVVGMAAGKTAFGDVSIDDFKSLRDAVRKSHRQGALFFLGAEIVSILEGKKNLQGDYQFRSPTGTLPAMLWGYPIADVDGVAVFDDLASAVGTRFAIFGNPKNRLFGSRREKEVTVATEAVIQADDGSIAVNLFQQDAKALRISERVGFKGINQAASAALKTAAA